MTTHNTVGHIEMIFSANHLASAKTGSSQQITRLVLANQSNCNQVTTQKIWTTTTKM